MTKRLLYWVGLTLLLILPIVFVGNLMITEQDVIAQGKITALSLSDELDQAQQIAQRAALADSRVQAYTTGYRTEVFGVQTVSHQFSDATSECANADCRQVNIFNFDKSATIAAMVNVESATVLDVLYQPNIRPGINKRLADRAMEIALNAPEVIEVLGYQPTSSDWAPMDSSFADSLCEEGHMCVAPTFNLGKYILWAVVDLTDEQLVDLYWTAVRTEENDGSIRYPDEYDDFTEVGCTPASGAVNQNGWVMDWEVTAHDGFHIYDVSFNDDAVLTSAKLVEWHTDYGGTGYVDSTGCGGGGGGFPIRSFGDMQQRDLVDNDGNMVGFELVQDFRMSHWGQPCQYRYGQHYQFYDDGRYRVVAGAYGKGCASAGIYRPIIRIDVAVDGDENDKLEVWDGNWSAQESEVRVGPNSNTSPDGYVWRVLDQSGKGYFIEPGNAQFGDAGRGDNEFLYAVQYHEGEGDADLGIFSIGCCNDNEHGPEIYLNDESIDKQNIVLWYVPQLEISFTPQPYCWTVSTSPLETYPCFGGPMFTPFEPVTQPQVNFEFTNADANICGSPVHKAVQFINSSTGGGYMTYKWDFGNGPAGSTEKNPVTCYFSPVADHYDVTLTVTNELGTAIKTLRWTNMEYAQAVFTHTMPVKIDTTTYFTNTSTGGGTMSYEWDFADGHTSTDMNVSHMYTQTGTYTVTLAANNEASSDTIVKAIEVLKEDPTVVTFDRFESKQSSVPTLLLLWSIGSILAIVISLTRITSLYKR